jgi:hypothetical protein
VPVVTQAFILLQILSVALIIIKEVNKPQCYLGHGPNKALLVPDSLRATERIGNRINACVTTGTIENG